VAATATPKQGDHVFNDVETAIIGPFDTLRSLRSEFVEGQRFVPQYLLQSYGYAKHLAKNQGIAAARGYTASSGDEDQALREISRLRLRKPAFGRISRQLLRDTHARNAAEFGRAAGRLHAAVFATLQRSLEIAIEPSPAKPMHVAGESSLEIAYKEMLDAAYDPAAALVLITDSASRENTSIQAVFDSVILGISETLHRNDMWESPYAAFREDRLSNTGKIIKGIHAGLKQIALLKAAGRMLASLIGPEIAQHNGSASALADFGAMLHLVQTNLQQRHEKA
jgi:hypothetical protein